MNRKRYRQLKSFLNFESEAEKEIRSDIEGKMIKNCARVYEQRE
ncbi:MAG TPA: hypothetical protein PLL98_04605 [Bacillota bacterium]|nr:hypothetical protein [Bacillota bacterium]HOR85749.1 hypothetical protein [Bacillota bacterium]HPL53315.1 hypothetical protein [Bacillota bacterium]